MPTELFVCVCRNQAFEGLPQEYSLTQSADRLEGNFSMAADDKLVIILDRCIEGRPMRSVSVDMAIKLVDIRRGHGILLACARFCIQDVS
eukprot:scaffold4372_cov397-Prasinococcus_capsulatus_cf.AAC.14